MEGEMNEKGDIQNFHSEPDEFKRTSSVGTTLEVIFVHRIFILSNISVL